MTEPEERNSVDRRVPIGGDVWSGQGSRWRRWSNAAPREHAGPRLRRREWAGLKGLAVALLIAGLAGALPPHLSAQPGLAGNVQLDFQDLDLAYVMTALAQMAGVNLIYHDLPPKPVTLRTAQPVPRAQIPALIRSIAAANGVAVVDEGGFLRLIGTGAATEPDNRQLFIYRLRHARATVLGTTLQALFGGIVTQAGGAALRPPLSQQLQTLQGGQAQVTQTPQGIIIAAPQGAAGIQGNVLIVPDEVTNSLLIRATPADWAVLEQAVQALDLRPLQVVIEVLIVEVSRTSELDLGFSYQASRQTTGGAVSLDLPPRQTTPSDALAISTVRFGSVDIEATLSALSASGTVRVLSRPVILAQNNQQARILVGSQQPFIQLSQILPTDPSGARAEVVQYREVGTVLSILPTINEDGYVNLAVSQEVSSATAETQFGAPVISTREAETQLLARNGQTVVLGGLVDQQIQRSRQGIPLLKDIPVLGYLFGSTRETAGNSELFLFLTPYIVASDEDADLLREHIETERDLIEPYMPVVPITPPVDWPVPSGQPSMPPQPVEIVPTP